MKRAAIVLAVTAIATTGVVAQQRQSAPPPPPPARTGAAPQGPVTLVSSTKFSYDLFKGYVVKAAEQMTEADYAFKPAGTVAEVRTFGQLIGHLADANFGLCAAASGAAPPATAPKDAEHTVKGKAALQKALNDAFAFCDQAWAGTTDANAATAAEMPFGLGKSTRLAILSFNSSHNGEHYGNLVTYMRAKGLVPPSSAPAGRGRGGLQ